MLFSLGRVTEVWVIVRLLEQADIVGLMVHTKAPLKILWVPLGVVIIAHITSPLSEEVVRATEKDDRVRVDVLLELGSILLGELFR